MVASLRGTLDWRSLTPVVLLVAVALGGVGLWHYLQRPAPMQRVEVESLLKDKTAVGTWPQGASYLLYFAPDLSLAYREPERAVQQGRWRVEASGTLCLVLDTGETCYGVAREAGSLVWIAPGSGRTYPFAVKDGRDPAL